MGRSADVLAGNRRSACGSPPGPRSPGPQWRAGGWARPALPVGCRIARRTRPGMSWAESKRRKRAGQVVRGPVDPPRGGGRLRCPNSRRSSSAPSRSSRRVRRECAVAWTATRPTPSHAQQGNHRRRFSFARRASGSAQVPHTTALDAVGASPTRSGGLSLLALDAEADEVGVHASSRARARASAGRWAVQRMRARPSTAQCADRVSTAGAREGRGPARGARPDPAGALSVAHIGRRHACALGKSRECGARDRWAAVAGAPPCADPRAASSEFSAAPPRRFLRRPAAAPADVPRAPVPGCMARRQHLP
jgi:hypothetical protein